MNDDDIYYVRCADCGAPGQMAVTDACGSGNWIFENPACLAHWPHGALPKRAWLELFVIAERSRLEAAARRLAAPADDEEGDDE